MAAIESSSPTQRLRPSRAFVPMITRSVPSGSVCLRCQLRLAGSVPRRNPLLSSLQTNVRHHGTDASSASSASSATDATGEQSEPKNTGKVRRVGAPSKSLHGRQDPPSSVGQYYRSRGKRLYMKPENLGVGSLGKPAEAIVMKDAGAIRRRSPVLVKETGAFDGLADVWENFENEGRQASPEEVQANIDGLRPSSSGIILEREFRELGDVLLNGFTVAQLSRYMQDNAKTVELAMSSPNPEDPWILEQLPWVPEVPEADEDVELHLRGYLGKSMTAKEKLVVRLMRECWAVSIQELMDGQGRLDVRLRDVEFSLLMIGTQRWLQAISRVFLKPGKQVELIRSKNLIRIVAPKATSETILAEINWRLRSAITKSFELKEITPKPLEAAVLREAGRITNSHVCMDESGTKVRVTWVSLESRDPELEDLSETVYRLLFTAYKPSTDTTSRHVSQDGQHGLRLITDHGNQEKWPWKARLGRWARWVATTGFRPEPSLERVRGSLLPWEIEAPVQTEAPGGPLHTQAARVPEEEEEEPSAETPDWSSVPVTSTMAVFGHVLHALPPSTSTLVTKIAGTQLPQFERMLSPVVPPMFDMSLPADLPETATFSTVLLRLLPTAPSGPTLEVVLDASSPEHLSVSSLRAILEQHTADILLPTERVDIRMTQSRAFVLPGIALPAPLASFLDKSSLNLLKGNLQTPPRVSGLRLPAGVFLSSAVGGGKAGPGPDGLVEMPEYLFAGLEVRRTVETSYRGWKLVYTSVEAGQSAGRRGELSLEAVPAADPAAADQAVSTEDFIEAAYDLARGQGAITWVGENWRKK